MHADARKEPITAANVEDAPARNTRGRVSLTSLPLPTLEKEEDAGNEKSKKRMQQT